MRSRQMLCLFVAAALALGMVGCASTIDLSQAKRIDDVAAVEPEPVVTPSAQEQRAAERSAAADGCFVGSWLADNASFGALFHSLGVADNDQVTGTMRLTVAADGTLVMEYVDWTYEMTVFLPARTAVPRVQNEVISEVYVLNDDGSFSTGVDEEAAEESDGVYICDGDTLTMLAPGGAAILTRSQP